MSTVDLNKFQFDYDLTFAMTVHSPDGNLVSRFGGRDKSSANLWQQPRAIAAWLRELRDNHRIHKKTESRPKKKPDIPNTRTTIFDVPAFAKGVRGKKLECVHCHSIFPALRREAIAKKTWTPEKKFVYPAPRQIGIEMDPIHQTTLMSVTPKSSAHVAGLRPGDKLLSIENKRVFSIADFQHALHKTKEARTTLTTHWSRGDSLKTFKLKLKDGWKRISPFEYSWRPMKWELSPAPGFGGQILSQETKKELGLEEYPFAMRVDYIVDWGPRKSLGANVKKAGLRKGDIVLSINSKSDFRDADHFHAWIRLRCQVGQTIRIKFWRNGKPQRIELPLIPG